MKDVFNFEIKALGPISWAFLKLKLNYFNSAAKYIEELPYRRNSDKENPLTVFEDGCGTCSSKHAVLKRLADENEIEEVELILGLFELKADLNARIKMRLQEYGLTGIPEMHCYLKIDERVYDYTGKENLFPNQKAIKEESIEAHQITDYKVKVHKRAMQSFLKEHPELDLNLEQLWAIREGCIADLIIS